MALRVRLMYNVVIVSGVKLIDKKDETENVAIKIQVLFFQA